MCLALFTFRYLSIEIDRIDQKSMKIDNHSNECDRLLSIFDIYRLINIDIIDYYRFLSRIEIIDM